MGPSAVASTATTSVNRLLANASHAVEVAPGTPAAISVLKNRGNIAVVTASE